MAMASASSASASRWSPGSAPGEAAAGALLVVTRSAGASADGDLRFDESSSVGGES